MDRHSLIDDDDDELYLDDTTNVFDDSFEVDEDEDAVADGFRPGQQHDREGDERHDAGQPSSSSQPLASSYPPLIPSNTPSRNSTRKSRGHENPFASPEDGNNEQLLHRTPSGNYTPVPHRILSSRSSGQFARSNSQRNGATGPSHPYSMYPQGTLARTESVTIPSASQPQPSAAQGGPQHPYALYPQNIGDDSDDDDDEQVQNQVPLGFHGLGQTYRRQRGPDGEEQDIVGFYGHVEQLPPYSRYPDDGPEKQPLLPVPEPPTATHSRAPVQGTDPSMPLMHTQIEPTPLPQQQSPQSMTDESELVRQDSAASRPTSHLLASSDDSVSTDKSWSEKSWKEKRKTRVCGVPCWWFLAAVSVIAFVAVVTGGAVGGFVAGQQKAESNYRHMPTTTVYDASIVSAPTSTPPIPTGTWSLDLGKPHQTAAACLTTPSQRDAWDCDIAFGNEVMINVQPMEGAMGGMGMGANVVYMSNPDKTGLSYGTQASQMNTTVSPLYWVQDLDGSETSPALYFRSTFDKLVIIPENGLDLASRKIKRQLPPSQWTQDSVAGPSSKPWFCFWNDTVLEGFLYVEAKNIRPLPESLQPYSTPAWATSLTAAPSHTMTTTLTMKSTTAVFTGAVSSFPKWLHNNYPDFNYTSYTSAHPPTPSSSSSAPPLPSFSSASLSAPASTTGAGLSARQYLQQESEQTAYNNLTLYPYRVKLEERRLPGSRTPYCTRYQVLNDGKANWIPGSQGQQVIIQLNERDPPFRPLQNGGGEHSGDGKGRVKAKRDEFIGSCHCQWLSGGK